MCGSQGGRDFRVPADADEASDKGLFAAPADCLGARKFFLRKKSREAAIKGEPGV